MTANWLDAFVALLLSLLNTTWQGGLLAVAVLVATRCLGARMRASCRFALWLVVFARLSTPWAPSAPWSPYQFLPKVELVNDARSIVPHEPSTAVVNESQGDDFVRDIDPARRRRPRAVAQTTPGGDALEHGDRDPATERLARVSSVSLWHCLALGWLAGAVVGGTRIIRRFVRLANLRSSWPAVVDPVLCALFERCRRETRVHRAVTLHLSSSNIGPAACGLISPAVVLPGRLADSLDGNEMRLVLLHELIHVRRHDALVDFVASGIACLHWFNPMVWLALSQLRRERELACDAAVLDLLGTGVRKAYGSVLLKAVETLQSAPVVTAAVAMIERRFFSDSLAGRIQMIANYRPTSRAGRLAGGMLLIMLAGLGLTDAATPPAREAASVAVKNVGNNVGDNATSAAPADESVPDDVLPPVAAERPAAERIRALGGWYVLDADRHVIEVNMCFHYDSSGERHENEQKTDKALAHLPDFPRVRRLLVCETQVSDDGLEFVGRLPELEELFIWDGATITDKGVAHLRGLRKLKFLLLGHAAITDEAISHLSGVISLETLLLDSNELTDKSLEYASKLPRLRELELGNYDPESRQARISAAGLEHVRKMPALKQLGIPLIPTAVEDLKPLHGLTGLELLGIEDVLNHGQLNETAIFDLQRATPHLKVVADRKIFPSLKRIVAGADPEQQEIYRRQGAEGLRVIERFLELMWAKRDAEAAQLGDIDDAIAECRRFRRAPGFVPFKVTRAYADSENVLAITEPPVTYKIYELHDGKKREIGEQTAHVILSAIKIKGIWRIKNTYTYDQEPGSDVLPDWFQRFLSENPGAQRLDPFRPAKP